MVSLERKSSKKEEETANATVSKSEKVCLIELRAHYSGLIFKNKATVCRFTTEFGVSH